MKTYEVEMRRVSYTVINVEADDENHAETLAWEEIHFGESYGISGDADWAMESIKETK